MEQEENQNLISSPEVLNRNVTLNIADARGCAFFTGDIDHSVINSGSHKEVLGAGLPFTEVGIKKLRDNLIKAYRNLRCVQVSPMLEERRCDIDNIYVDLVIEEEKEVIETEQKCGNMEEEREYITQHKDAQSHSKNIIKVTSYEQLFLDERGLKFKRVYLRGKGGLGKTTFCRKVLHAWCNAHENSKTAQDSFFQDENVLRTFALLFYINLREVSLEENLIEVICTLFPLEEIPNKTALGTLLKENGDKVLFILDGLDEMIVKPEFIKKIVKRRVYPDCSFLISSRSWKISKMGLKEGTEIDLLLDLRGFSKKGALKYAEKIFNNCYKDGNVIEKFKKDIKSNKLASQLIHVPLLLLILTHVWYENERSLPSKLHELYIQFINLLTERVKEKYKDDCYHRQMRFRLGDIQSPLPNKISETSLVVNFGEGLLLSLCEVAHHFLLSSQKENSLVFKETKLLNALGDRGKEKLNIALDLGILSITDSRSYLDRKTNVSFLHETMQEFFTALSFILSPDKLAKFISSLVDLNKVQQNENIIVFLFGLMPEFGNSVLEKMNELCSNYWETLRNEKHFEIPKHEEEICAVSKIYLKCKEEVIGGENVPLNVSGLYLFIIQTEFDLSDINKFDFPGITEFDHHAWNPDFLQNLDLSGLFAENKEYLSVDLRGFTRLVYLRLQLLKCELYLPESVSLSVLIIFGIELHNKFSDVFGRTLTLCNKLQRLEICKTDEDRCLFDLSNMTELMHVSLLSSGCDALGGTLTHCTKLETLELHKIDLNDCMLDLSNMTKLTVLDMSGVRLSSQCCDVLGKTLTHCTKLETLIVDNTNLHDCKLNLSNMTELTVLVMSGVTLSSTCCDALGRTLTHCTKLKKLKIHKTNLHDCQLDLSNMTELTVLDMSSVTLSSSCCDVLGITLIHCTKLKKLKIHKTDLHDCQLDLSNMTELTVLDMSSVTLSSSCCDVLGITLIHCTKLKKLKIHKTDLHDCQLDLSNMTELTVLDMSSVTLSSSSCDLLGWTLKHCTDLKTLVIENTDLHNCLLDLSNLTELHIIRLDDTILSSSAYKALSLSFHKLKATNWLFRFYHFDMSQIDNDRYKVSMVPPCDECFKCYKRCCTLL